LLRRAGHTEAAVDLARLAGFEPSGTLVEIMNDDGSMARLPQLIEIARNLILRSSP
jgi:3,4-dihydroxy 2-butanone 4-phosphate synthase/GTP cyclohydrolase II